MFSIFNRLQCAASYSFRTLFSYFSRFQLLSSNNIENKSLITLPKLLEDFGNKLNSSDSVALRTAIAKTQKLDSTEIFEKMKNNICFFRTPSGNASGFFLNKELVVTAFHCICPDGFKLELENERIKLDANTLKVEFKQKEYSLSFIRPIEDDYYDDQEDLMDFVFLDKAQELDLIAFSSDEEVEGDFFKIIPEDFVLKEGMKVYLAGFPLSQTIPTFHRGIISSIKKDSQGNSMSFTIDGTIVAGNSGGPVLIQHEGELLLAGIIVAEVADVSHNFSEITAQCTKRVEDNGYPEIVYPGAMLGAFPKEAIDEKVNLMKLVLDVKKNISTGIGKAVDARYIPKLLNSRISVNDLPYFLEPSEIPVFRITTKKFGQGDCNEDRGNGGRGPRYVEFSLQGMKGSYKIEPNPHYISDYNKPGNQPKLYYAAAEAFKKKVDEAETLQFPPELYFTEYGEEFKASLEVSANQDNSPLNQALSDLEKIGSIQAFRFVWKHLQKENYIKGVKDDQTQTWYKGNKSVKLPLISPISKLEAYKIISCIYKT